MKPESKIKHRKSKIERAGFTLIELLAVISIITLMLGLGVLAFNSLTGRKSTAMARNQVAAMLSKARSIAINDQTTQSVSYGVIFFRDPDTERTAMAIARRDDTGGGDPDPHDNYKGWSTGVQYQVGDRVVAIVHDLREQAVTAIRFRCGVAHVSNQANRPPAWRPASDPVPLTSKTLQPGGPQYWVEVIDGGIGFPDEPIELLPVGVGVQLLMDSSYPTVITEQVWDRYARTGGIFFDHRGQMDHLSFAITAGSPIGLRMGLTQDVPPPTATPPTPLFSAVGVAIYDNQLFSSAGHTEEDWDDRVRNHLNTRPTMSDETNEETWIDNNANILTVDRYSGELSQIR